MSEAIPPESKPSQLSFAALLRRIRQANAMSEAIPILFRRMRKAIGGSAELSILNTSYRQTVFLAKLPIINLVPAVKYTIAVSIVIIR